MAQHFNARLRSILGRAKQITRHHLPVLNGKVFGLASHYDTVLRKVSCFVPETLRHQCRRARSTENLVLDGTVIAFNERREGDAGARAASNDATLGRRNNQYIGSDTAH